METRELKLKKTPKTPHLHRITHQKLSHFQVLDPQLFSFFFTAQWRMIASHKSIMWLPGRLKEASLSSTAPRKHACVDSECSCCNENKAARILNTCHGASWNDLTQEEKAHIFLRHSITQWKQPFALVSYPHFQNIP